MGFIKNWLLCCTITLLPLCSTAQWSECPQIDAYFKAIGKHFDEQKAYKTVAFVEKRWRLAGNRGYNESIFEVASILKKAGYIPESLASANSPLVYRIEKRAMNRPAFEPIDAIVAIEGEKLPLLSFSNNRNMLAINSGNTPPEGITAEVVYVANPTKQALDSLDLSGKILFVEQNIAIAHRTAINRGAIGTFAYQMPAYTKPEKNQHSIQFGSVPIVKGFQQVFGILLSYRAKERLLNAIKRGKNKVWVRTESKQEIADELTLIAQARGHSLPKEEFVFSAHVQEPGANDNASGVGTLAEMARVTALLVQQKQINLDRSITFLWGDEIVSTRRYVNEMTKDTLGRQIAYGLSLDMVGEDTQKTGGTFLIEKMPDPSVVWTRGEDHHTEWGGQALPESSIVPHFFNDFLLNRCYEQAKQNNWTVKSNPFEGGSDHTPFLEGHIPAALFWHFTDEFYHTDSDRLVNVSPKEMRNVGISALVAAFTLCTAQEQTIDFLIDELYNTAQKRIAIEQALSAQAIQQGANEMEQNHIVATWKSYYREALNKLSEIRKGGFTATQKAKVSSFWK